MDIFGKCEICGNRIDSSCGSCIKCQETQLNEIVKGEKIWCNYCRDYTETKDSDCVICNLSKPNINRHPS